MHDVHELDPAMALDFPAAQESQYLYPASDVVSWQVEDALNQVQSPPHAVLPVVPGQSAQVPAYRLMPQSTAEYFPASQLAQELAPVDTAKVPAAQEVQLEDAATLDFPATQSVQMLDPSTEAYFPATQFVHVDADKPENVPKAQLTQDVYNPL